MLNQYIRLYMMTWCFFSITSVFHGRQLLLLQIATQVYFFETHRVNPLFILQICWAAVSYSFWKKAQNCQVFNKPCSFETSFTFHNPLIVQQSLSSELYLLPNHSKFLPKIKPKLGYGFRVFPENTVHHPISETQFHLDFMKYPYGALHIHRLSSSNILGNRPGWYRISRLMARMRIV